MPTIKQNLTGLHFKYPSTLVNVRDVIILTIGIVLGTIVSIPLQQYSYSNFPIVSSPYSQLSTLSSGKTINSYNSRIVTQCPHSANYSKGGTKLVCGRTCDQNYTVWSAPGINTLTDKADDPNILQMRAHIAPYFASKQPKPIDILDVGANIGVVTAAILSQGIGHRILAVEPVEVNLNQLCKTAQLNSWLNSPRLTMVHAAASDHIATETIYIPIGRGDNAALSTDAATKNVLRPKRAEQIFLLDGDGLLKEIGFNPRIIKIDTQGHELYVLRGLKKFLSKAGKGEVLIIAELDFGLTKASGVNVMDLYKLMVEELGYSVVCNRKLKLDSDGKVVGVENGKPMNNVTFSKATGCGDAYYFKL